jgi:hypothetical protein
MFSIFWLPYPETSVSAPGRMVVICTMQQRHWSIAWQ